MPIVTTVDIQDVATGVMVQANIEDIPGPSPGTSFVVDVVFVCDAGKVVYVDALTTLASGATQAPNGKTVTDESIELWWQLPFDATKHEYDFEVQLDWKDGAEGSAKFAWTTVSSDTSSSSDERFKAKLGAFQAPPADPST